MKRKEKDSDALEVEEATVLVEREHVLEEKDVSPSRTPMRGKKKNETISVSPLSESVEGGFLGSGTKPLSAEKKKSFGDKLDKETQKLKSCTDASKGAIPRKPSHVGSGVKPETLETSSSSDDEDQVLLVAAKPVFQGNRKKPRTLRGKKK